MRFVCLRLLLAGQMAFPTCVVVTVPGRGRRAENPRTNKAKEGQSRAKQSRADAGVAQKVPGRVAGKQASKSASKGQTGLDRLEQAGGDKTRMFGWDGMGWGCGMGDPRDGDGTDADETEWPEQSG
ncbi:hypothetical protein B0J13DRAFT_29684 [Dactylonectria estremocensis]|uniref:Secreted protein n=1 Tax=Dactylonectria estremocensis TaxID=1079267 RepID=A0A9P9FKE7_9HYPO|nr:hypothetical protein B0J13DRAFT_29684 [Dactylonectria estremocensis]